MRGLHSHFLSVHVLYSISVTLSRRKFLSLLPARSLSGAAGLKFLFANVLQRQELKDSMTPLWDRNQNKTSMKRKLSFRSMHSQNTCFQRVNAVVRDQPIRVIA
jgi:hypothetical protein